MPGPLLKVQMWFCVASARDCAPGQKWTKRGWFCSISKTEGRRGAFAEDLQSLHRRTVVWRTSSSLSIWHVLYTSVYLVVWCSLSSLSVSICLFIYTICLSICLPICLSVCLSVYVSIYLSIYLSDRSIDLSLYLSASLKMKLFCETSSFFELDNIKNAAILREFLNFLTWQRQKLSNSARLSQFLKLATSKMKQFYETSFKHGKLSAEPTASYQSVLRFFHSISLKCCTCHAKSSSQSWRSDAPKCNLSQEISARTS